jgi:arsenate reductase
MAEGFARELGKGKVASFSCGSLPKGVHPMAVETMKAFGIDISGQTSKHIDVFAGQPFDYVITVCDRAKESCPIWPGAKDQIHWSIEDPAEEAGSPQQRAAVFRRVASDLKNRIDRFLMANHLRAGSP